ncbi:MAG: hypothetical protein JWM12_1895 [Ilumatobacteraceae bacterium]|nr:hypothetical protein [Ilumatobacteraceae bacterium]
MTNITASFDVTKWDEHEFDVHAGAGKLTKAHVTKTYTGDIDGTSTTEWLMAYAADGTAAFVGLERISGTVAGRTGTLVLQHVGGFADGAAKAALTVVTGSCAGELAGAVGAGDFVADPAGTVALELTLA